MAGNSIAELRPARVLAGEFQGLAAVLDGKPAPLAYFRLDDFEASWAQINSYDWISTGHATADFTIRAQAAWESASEQANWWNSGCGFVFRLNARGDHYLILLGMDGSVHLYRNVAGIVTRIGREYVGGLRLPQGSAQVQLAARGPGIEFFVDGVQALSKEDETLSSGLIGLALASGSNKGFGTSCRMTDIELVELASH